MDSNGDSQHREHHSKPPLAVIGMACRFAGGVVDVESFWDLLASGRSGIVEIPADRWNAKRYYHPDTAVPNRMHTKWGGFIDQLQDFDARFWGISPREAARMDPQQRWLLEVSWEAIEDAGVPPQALSGTRTGVFVGISSSDYAQIQMTNHFGLDVHSNSGNTLSIASNRISYALDLKGPSVSIDTACSSSLVAASLACQSIWDGTCDAALIGGVNAVIVPSTTMAFSKATMLSPDGQCFAFDSRANGYVRGDGAGMVYVKPLAKALQDGDPIYGVIRAAVANQDGKTSSMMVPGVHGQIDMLEQAYAEAGIPPSRVKFVEAHGTGTPTGDPIEATALGNVLSRGRSPDDRCLLGSVKTNIGHLEAGSGIAGLIKAILVLHKNTVPPNLNFERANPSIPFDRLQLKVATELTELPRGPAANVAAVNSFGFGGTNAHVVLEAAPTLPSKNGSQKHAPPAQRPCLLPISARDDSALRDYVKAYARHLRDSSLPLADLCYSAGERKEHHSERLAVTGKNHEELRDRLSEWLNNPEGIPGVVTGSTQELGPLTFVFTGQGSQWWAMGQQLLKREPIVRETIERIDGLIAKLSDWSLIDEMTRSEDTSRINETYIAQPAIFALQVALTELWKSWGIVPDQVIGHSVGEVSAAYAAGVYSLEDAVRVIVHRSRLQHTTGGKGRMLAAGVAAANARQLIGSDTDTVHIAAINSPNLITLSGDTGPLERVAQKLADADKFYRWLPIDYAFHTHQMEPIKDELLNVLADIDPQPGHIPFISTVTGGVLLGEKLDANYWWRNVREPVLFAPGLSSAMSSTSTEGNGLFLEVGPHPSLRSSIEDCLADRGRRGVVLHSQRRETDESEEMLANLAALHALGVPVDWKAVNQSAGRFVRLPRYPWNTEKLWIESDQSVQKRLAELIHPLLGLRAEAVQPTWEFDLDPRLFPYLNDHQIWGGVVFPASGFGEIGLALANELFPDAAHVVESIDIEKALFAFEDKRTTVRIVFNETDKSFCVYSSTGDLQSWELHARGQLTPLISDRSESIDLERLRESLPNYVDHERYYEGLLAAGYGFGPNFRQIQNVWSANGEALAEIEVPEELLDSLADYYFHPAVLDACFQVFRATQAFDDETVTEQLLLPSEIRRICLYGDRPPTRLWAHAQQALGDDESLVCDVFVYDDDGNRVADILGFRLDLAEQKSDSDAIENCLYQFKWEPCRLRGTGAEGSCHLSPTEQIVAAAREAVPPLYEEYGLGEYSRDYVPRSERIISEYIQNAFIKLGWQPSVGDVFEFSDLVRQLGIVRQHHGLARVQLKTLVEHDLLRHVAPDRWEVLQLPQTRCMEAAMDGLEADYPRLAATEVALSRKNGHWAAEILSGEVNPAELLFPGGSSKLLGQFYAEGLDFPAINRLIPITVTEAIKNLPPRRTLRVLEIGAGTGSLTSHVLPVLPADRTEYLFTDIGPAFLAPAKSQFEEYPFVDYRVFDLEKPAAEQGIDLHSFDLILASDVFHATADLRRTFANVQSCLAEDGMLIFIEPTHMRSGTDAIFGGLPGWWAFTDTDLRPDHALMETPKWLSLLSDCGYRDVRAIIATLVPEEAEQAILVAVAPELTVEVGDEEPDSEAQAVETEEQCLPAAHLVIADEGGVADAVIERLTSAGERTIRVELGQSFQQQDGHRFTVTAESESDLLQVLDSAGPIKTVTHCPSLDHPDGSQLSLTSLEGSQRTGVLHALRLAHVLAEHATEQPPRVFFVTRDAQQVVAGDGSSGLASSPIVGFARVANSEHNQFRWTVVDLPAQPADTEAEFLFNELVIGDDELEVAYRENQRYTNRLQRVRANELPKRTRPAVDATGKITPYRLQIDKPGVLTNLSLNETDRPAPGPNEIEVRVAAGGVNFRDVMKALGMYPGRPVDLKWFGDDFAGQVERVGASVTQFAVGDRVAGMSPYCFRTYARSDWRTAFHIPSQMPFDGAATLPTVFLTAHYAINHLARMQSGERILIHAAAGGVGQAAIQISQHLGLEVFATAGTDEKRQLLRDLGVPHIMNSRTLDFADEVMEITQGRGVDAVLNSLAGPFVPKSAAVLAPFGRFLEIGKVDVYNNTKVGLETLKDNISYFVIDLAQCLEHKPQLVASMFGELAERFETGDFRPLSHKIFPVSEVVDAFRYMAQGKHIGKNVLDFECDHIPIGPCLKDGHLFSADASYLITGGVSGFGLEVSKWMARHGAKHLVLMSRSGPPDAKAKSDLQQLQELGVDVVDARGDVTDPADVRRVVQEIQAAGPPLKGVIHGAMVLDDDFIADLDDKQFNRVLHPKMLGAWNLHTETRDLPLDHFICFSSFSDVAGGTKQSNYNAGNFFLDSLAAYRHGLGLPALTYNWGGISGAGFVHRNENVAQYFDKIGFHSFDVEEVLGIMQELLQYDPVQLAVGRLNWQKMERFSQFIASSNMYAPLTRERGKDGGGASARPMILAAPPEERLGMVKALLTKQLSAVCNIDASKVDHETSIIKLGLDSLMAIEMINRVENELGLVLPMGKVLGGPTLTELGETVVQLLTYAADEQAGGDGAASGAASTLTLMDTAKESHDAAFLSERQQAVWFLRQLAPESPSDNVAFAARIRPALDPAILKQAFAQLVERHPMLSATTSEGNGTPVLNFGAAAVGEIEVNELPPSDADLRESLTQYASAPFDLQQGPAVRLHLLTGDDSSVVLFAAHHLVADDLSLSVVMHDLFDDYQMLSKNGEITSESPQATYQSFVAWEQNYLESDAAQRSITFWKEQIAGAPARLQLPVDRPRPAQQRFEGLTHGFQLNEGLTHELMLLATEQNVSLSTALLSVFELLMHKICDQHDLVIGCPMTGRSHEELSDVVGCFDNPVALRSNIQDDPTFLEFLHRNQRLIDEAVEHQDLPLPRILAQLDVPREAGRSPLYQAAFAMHSHLNLQQQGIAPFLVGQTGHKARFGDLALESLDFSLPRAPVELMLRAEEAGGRIFGCWQYRSDLFEPATIASIDDLFVRLLRELVGKPFAKLSQLFDGLGTTGISTAAATEDTADECPVVGRSPGDTAESGYVAPRTETEHYVVRVWEELLQVRPIGVQDSFFALGGHSLNLTVLCSQLHRMFGVDVPLTVAFEKPTVEAISEFIDSRRGAHAQPIVDPTEVEFERDALLDDDIVAPAATDYKVDKMDRVLLTGGTGFLGAFLLDELLRQTDADIYCLVRASSARHGWQRISKNLEKYGLDIGDSADRVIPVVGDLSQPRLGLSQAQFDQLAADIDVIYHNGAVLNFAYSYKVLRDSNVQGTHEVLRLAMKKRLKPTHYVSTVAVQASSKLNAWDVVAEDDPLPSFASLKDGYSQTKWMSEKLVAEARRRGLPVSIYRPGGVTGHSVTGQSNTGDLVHVMVLGCFHLGTIPHLDVELNLAPVDFVAGALVTLSRKPQCLGQTFHLVNPEALRLDTLDSWVKKSQLPLERLPVEQWRQQVTSHIEALPSDVFGLLTKSFMPGVLAGETNDAIPAVLQLRYDCQHTLSALSRSGIRCPKVDEQMLAIYFSHLQRYGLVASANAE